MGLASRCPGEERGHSVCPICMQQIQNPTTWADLGLPDTSRDDLDRSASPMREGSTGETSPLCFTPWPRSLMSARLQKGAVDG